MEKFPNYKQTEAKYCKGSLIKTIVKQDRHKHLILKKAKTQSKQLNYFIMKKSILKLGKTLSKTEQKNINGGLLCGSRPECSAYSPEAYCLLVKFGGICISPSLV